jgi:hypothetical protein
MSNQAKAPLELAADIARTIQRDQATDVAGNDMTHVIYSAGIIVRALDRLVAAVKENTAAINSMDGTLYTAGLPNGHPDKIV